MAEKSDPVPVFKLTNSNDNFSAKSADIFGCLSVIEKKHEAYQVAHSADKNDDTLVKPDPEEDKFIGKDASRKMQRKDDRKFKRPDFARPYNPRHNRGRGGRRTPDYKVNPQRWTKYTLEDVEGTDMTESSNTRAAFEFLDERRKIREMAENPEAFQAANVEATACSKGAITFTRKKKEKSETSEKSKDIVLPTLEDCDDENSGNLDDKESKGTEQKVTFKSKKSRQRNIRSRHSDEDEDQNG